MGLISSSNVMSGFQPRHRQLDRFIHCDTEVIEHLLADPNVKAFTTHVVMKDIKRTLAVPIEDQP